LSYTGRFNCWRPSYDGETPPSEYTHATEYSVGKSWEDLKTTAEDIYIDNPDKARFFRRAGDAAGIDY